MYPLHRKHDGLNAVAQQKEKKRERELLARAPYELVLYLGAILTRGSPLVWRSRTDRHTAKLLAAGRHKLSQGCAELFGIWEAE
jgi:hypothetical protein